MLPDGIDVAGGDMLQYEWYMQVEKCKRSNEVNSSCILRGILKLYQQHLPLSLRKTQPR